MPSLSSPSATTAALDAAWKLHHQLQVNSRLAYARYRWMQGGLIGLAVTVTLLAVSAGYSLPFLDIRGIDHLRSLTLVLAGLGFTVLFALTNRLRDGQYWLSLATGVATLERAIYLYRTLLQFESERPQWLHEQIAQVQRQMLETLGNNWVLQPAVMAEGIIPVTSEQRTDWGASEYLQHRLVPEIERARTELTRHTATRHRLRLFVFGCGGLCVLWPLISPHQMGLVAAVSTLGLGLVLWFETLRLNQHIEAENQCLLGLVLLRDHWQSLGEHEQTGQVFFRMVMAAEDILCYRFGQATSFMQTALVNFYQNNADLVQRIANQPPPPELEAKLQPALVLQESNGKGQGTVGETPAVLGAVSHAAKTNDPQTTQAESATNGRKPTSRSHLATTDDKRRSRPHAFVVMPFGRKQAADGHWIDFNSVYQKLIKPSLERAGFEPFRADEETTSGDILTDMFQELLLADLVVADLSIDNANVFYELGIRHAMRKRGVVHIQSGRAYMPFDIFNVRTLPYHCDDTGRPDLNYLEADQLALMKMIENTWKADRHLLHSPIFNLLNGLVEPDRKTLRTPLATGYWREYTTLQSRIAIAQRQKRIGDVVLLAEEVSNPLIKEDIITEAGKALKSMGNSALALKEYKQGLKINPDSIDFRCEEAYHLHRLGQSDDAIVRLEGLLNDVPDCVNAACYLARIYKDMWREKWMTVEDIDSRIELAYAESHLLQKAIESYLRGYRIDQNEYYPGINALTLTAILEHLASTADIDNGDPEELTYRQMLPAIQGAVRFCLESTVLKSPGDPWAALSLGDLAVCTAEKPQQVAFAYKKALTLLWNSKFALQAVLGQLELLKLLQFRPDFVKAGMDVLQAELQRYEKREQLFAATDETSETDKVAQVFLFAGHMVDKPDRPKPRFPKAMEAEAVERIEAVLDKLDAHSNCTAITPGIACGGDILFIEACLRRSMRVDVYLPFEPSDFISRSVSFAGDRWVERFYTILNHPNVSVHLQPERLGPVPEDDNPFERNNRWALYSTLSYDISRVRLIVLWNGKGGDAPGGTGDMVQQVRQLGGIVEHIDTTQFNYWKNDQVKEKAVPQPVVMPQ